LAATADHRKGEDFAICSECCVAFNAGVMVKNAAVA
jgi:hypothetical protein